MKSTHLTHVDQPQLALSRRAVVTDIPLSLVIAQTCMSSAIALCIQAAGLQESEVSLSLGIDAGHWTRIKKGDAHFPLNKLNDLMNLCGNEVPLTWLANSRGYGLVLLKSEAERQRDEAEHALELERQKNQMLMDLLKGRASA